MKNKIVIPNGLVITARNFTATQLKLGNFEINNILDKA